MKPIIEVKDLSKKYSVNKPQGGYITLRDTLSELIKKPMNLFKSTPTNKDFWALKDIAFNVNPGETIGIIGSNGAGKSTLLKILTKITPPTDGQVILRGNIASLLEVGTGFHLELTGRENIYLYGSILGMTRKEINKKFEAIVEFSGIKQFLDTPIKHYSSGMQVRLAFAVASHLDSDILLVDEILAVGDLDFQKKSINKMEDITKSEGRTIIFVSHNMDLISRLCDKVIILEKGKILINTDTTTAIRKYTKTSLGITTKREWDLTKNAPGENNAKLKSIRIFNSEGKSLNFFDIQDDLYIEVVYQNLQNKSSVFTSLEFCNEENVLLFVTTDWGKTTKSKGLYKSTVKIPGNLFAEGLIRTTVKFSSSRPMLRIHFTESDVLTFQITDKGAPGSMRDGWAGDIPGVLRPKLDWKNELVTSKG